MTDAEITAMMTVQEHQTHIASLENQCEALLKQVKVAEIVLFQISEALAECREKVGRALDELEDAQK